MADAQCGEECATIKGVLSGKGRETVKEATWSNNVVAVQILGICSVLAVTTRVSNSIAMGLALMFVAGGASFIISLLRDITPKRIRIIAKMAIIAVLVIIVDQILKAFYWEMSRALGPYVGLIITNCLVLGRGEAFAQHNPPLLSAVDGVATAAGYAGVLVVIGLFRELIGAGEILGFTVLSPEWYPQNQFMILAPGAFIALGFLIAVFNHMRGETAAE